MFGLNPKRKILEKKQKLLSEKMTHKVITCFFCFEQFEVSLEIDTSFTGNISEIHGCEICCNPIEIHAVFEAGALQSFDAGSIEQ